MSDERCTAQNNRFPIVQHFVDWVLFTFRFYVAKRRYVLYGRLVLAGKPRGGATIRLLRATSATEGSSSLTISFSTPKATETNRTGRFRLAVTVKRRTDFFAIWFPFPREGCSSPSTAPGGCQTESTSPAVSSRLVVRP